MKKLIFTLSVFFSYQAYACTGITGSVDNIVCLADSLKSTMTSTQIATMQLSYSYSNSQVWSNLPTTFQPRLGISLGSLSSIQLSIAKLLIKEVSGMTSMEGYEEFEQLLLADEYLKNNGGGASYGSGLYYLCFNGTPSLTGAFSIKLGGHHLHIENTYNNGVMVGGTPHFEAIEPLSFVSSSVTYQPINEEKVALSAMLTSLGTSELSTAHLSSTFGDIIMGATNGGTSKDWTFPTTKVGLRVGNLTSAQKTKVLDAIKTYVLDVDDIDANAIIAQYTSDLDETYIAYSGNTSLASAQDYVRIDGPNVWIEFSVQNGIVMSGVHYHSIWRDHYRDYGGQGSTAGLQTTQVGTDTATGIFNENNIDIGVSVYPNPTTDYATLLLSGNNITIQAINLTDINGKIVKRISNINTIDGQQIQLIDLSDVANGIYFIELIADKRKNAIKLIKR